MNPVAIAISAVIGYAIGSVQILLLEWLRRRIRHRQHLRALRSELRRAAGFTQKFAWDPQAGPKDNNLPRPPTVSSRYADLIVETEFYLTDEHDDDNTQEALLGIVDGCEGLKHYVTRIHAGLDTLRATSDPATHGSVKNDLMQIAQAYDKELEKVLFVIKDAIRELDRRLREARSWAQLNRPMGRLPPGKNPPPLTDGDPRIGRSAA